MARRLALAYAVFLLVNILPPLATGGLIPAGRPSSVVFRVFIWMAQAILPRYRGGWIATFADPGFHRCPVLHMAPLY